MLQRIQTVWLFLASVCAFLSFKFSYYSGSITQDAATGIFKTLNATENIYLIVLTTAVAVLALITIFLYKKRTLQLRLCIVGLLLQAIVIFLYYTEVKKFSAGEYSLTALLQGCIALFFFMAARGINNDNKIIRDSNRLR